MPNWSPTPVRADGEYLTGQKYQADRQQAADADTPLVQDDYSATLPQMQLATDPAPGGVPALATSLAGELERLRYVVRQVKQTLAPGAVTDWYDVLPVVPPPGGLPAGGTAGQYLAKASATDFDAGWVTPPANGLPTGGTAGQTLTKASAADYAAAWTTPTNVLPAGGTTGQVLAKASAADYATAWSDDLTLDTVNVVTSLRVLGLLDLDNPLTPADGGVPAGGATNAILVKTSGSDYAAGWTLTPTLTDLTLTGILTSKHAVRAAAAVDGSAATFVNQFGFTACAKVSAGVYRLTLAAAVTYPIAVVTPLSTVSTTAVSQVESTTQFLVRTFAADVATDSSFIVHVASP